MDPVTAALMAGAVAGLTGTASKVITDAYEALKAVVKRRLAGDGDAVKVMALHEEDPQAAEPELEAAIERHGLSNDQQLLAMASALLAAVSQVQSPASKYVIDAREANGSVMGDNNIVTQTFN